MAGIDGFIVEGQREYATWAGCVNWLEGDGLSTADAITAAGLDWTVEVTPCYGPTADQPHGLGDDKPTSWQQIPGRYAVRRTDTGSYFTAGVGGQYTPIQNRDAFDFGDELLGGSEAPWVSGGNLRDGGIVYMQARLTRDILIGGMEDERIDPLLTLSNSHDGTASFQVNLTPVRVVCENTCRMAIGDARRQYRIQHRTNVAGKLQQAREALQLSYRYFDELEKIGNRLLRAKVSDRTINAFLEGLFPIPDGVDLDTSRIASNRIDQRDAVKAILVNKPDLQNVNRTKWGVYQAVCDWADHDRRTIDTDRTSAAENQFMRIVFSDDQVKDTALTLLTA